MNKINSAPFSQVVSGLTVLVVFILLAASVASNAWPRSETGYVGTRPDDAAKLAQIADEYFEQRLRFFPLSATEDVGDPRFEGALEIDIAPTHRAEQAAVFGKILSRVRALDRSQLSKSDVMTYDLLIYDVGERLDALKFPNHLLPIHHMESVPVKLAQWGSGNSVQPFKTIANYDNYLKRIEKLPAWAEQAITNMREGMRTGVTQNRAIVERSLSQYEALTETNVEKNPFFCTDPENARKLFCRR
jgi:uncharacterized protein (DUF885 family)